MPIGVTLLIALWIAIFFGAAHRVLDRLYLSDKAALIIVAGIIVGSFFEIPVSQEPFISINIGGALIPVMLAIYVLIKAGSEREWISAIVASIFTGGVIYGVSLFFRNFGEGRDIIDPMYIFVVVGGIFGYIFGRSRRRAFISGTLGFLLYSLVNVGRVLFGNLVTDIRLGGAGLLDSIVLSGIIAVLLAEVIGETRERLQGGPVKGNNRPGKEGSEDNEK